MNGRGAHGVSQIWGSQARYSRRLGDHNNIRKEAGGRVTGSSGSTSVPPHLKIVLHVTG